MEEKPPMQRELRSLAKKYYRKHRILAQWLLLFLLGSWMIFSDPFGVGSASERASETAFYRLTAKHYDAQKSQPNILVVLFNDRSIDNLYPTLLESNDWPLSYLDQVNLLSTIMTHSPSALFYDVMWVKQRSLDESYERAVSKLKLVQEKTQVPLFFARGVADSKLDEHVEEQLSEFTTLVVNGWEAREDLYPLYSQGAETTATALYRTYCESAGCQPPESNSLPVSVRWSAKAAPVLLEHRKQECEVTDPSIFGAVWNGGEYLLQNTIPGLNTPEVDQLCPPHRVLFADELMVLARSPNEDDRIKLKKWIEDSIVLVGGHIEGIHDYVISPVHGALPGVFFHAMALDNLMVYEDEYIRDDPNAKLINLIIWMVYISLLLVVRNVSDQFSKLYWLKNSTKLFSVAYVAIVIGIVFGVLHLSPSNWISILALGWLGNKLIERLDKAHLRQEAD
ncbi:CHASE2 domain-containing protein [Vibrio sp. HN007]|uniref:CHASE2 domain-containing protein n=1 Tax=Vibrio iocasae TaxID=3098914 RepID=UPI0035D4441B